MKRYTLPAVAVVVASFAGSVAAQERLHCDRKEVRTILSSGAYENLCGCDTITDKSIRKIQRSHKFDRVLTMSVEQCSGLADLLFDDSVISTRSTFKQELEFEPDEPYEPPTSDPEPETPEPETPEPETPDPESPDPETPDPETEEPEEIIYNGW